jgi:hypothetical protein
VQRVSDVLYTPGIAALVVVAAWTSSFVANSRVATTGIAIASIALMLGSASEALASWLRTPFDAKERARFSEWRSLIPEDSEVLWHQAPQAVWFLLDRRSYLTVSQAAGTVFSLETTQEIARRAESLSALVAPGVWYLDPSAKFEEFQELTTPILRDICRERSLGFVVSAVDLGTQVASAEWPGKGDFVYLYDCSVEREHAAR